METNRGEIDRPPPSRYCWSGRVQGAYSSSPPPMPGPSCGRGSNQVRIRNFRKSTFFVVHHLPRKEGPPYSLILCFIAGEERASSSSSLWHELCALRNFCDGLENKGVVWLGRGDGEGGDLREELSALMETVRQMGPRGKAEHRRHKDDSG